MYLLGLNACRTRQTEHLTFYNAESVKWNRLSLKLEQSIVSFGDIMIYNINVSNPSTEEESKGAHADLAPNL